MGFACYRPAASVTIASPPAISFASNPISLCYRNVVRLCVSHKPSLMHTLPSIPAIDATDWSLDTTVGQNK